MRLTDEEIRDHRDRFGKLAVWMGAPGNVSRMCAGITAALDELLERRRVEHSGSCRQEVIRG